MKHQANRLDPMLPSPPSTLDRKGELDQWEKIKLVCRPRNSLNNFSALSCATSIQSHLRQLSGICGTPH
jgi:hypothetical protein